jgi:flagellin-like hook-associated protein FlgL
MLDRLSTKMGGAGAQGATLTVTANDGTEQTITFGTGTDQVSTLAEFGTKLEGLHTVSASLSGTSATMSVASGTSATSLVVGGTAASALGLATSQTGAITTTAASTTRASLQNDFNNVLTQIDSLAKDASYNGNNLLNGDDLKVTFNENGSSSLTIKGVKFDSNNLGMNAQAGTAFQDNASIDAVIANADKALNTLRTQASKFGSTLTTVQTRQEFTKNMINTLQTGADALVLADTNEEGANLLALQTRQQLSTTALSMANQASQAVLRLF